MKLAITVFATAVLLMYMETFRYLADRAADPAIDLSAVRNASPAVHAALALLVLLVPMVLSVYKPRGMTQYGERQLGRRRAPNSGDEAEQRTSAVMRVDP